MNAVEKQALIEEYGQSPDDTGSVEVQVALLTHRIRHLTEHLKLHIHDHHSRYGLVKLVSARRKHLKYLKSNAINRYRELIQKLGLRH